MQEEMSVPEGFTDADVGCCRKTRRSTSGGVLRHGEHVLCAWPSAEKVVALSCCESECYSLVRCASESIGMQETLRELGHAATMRLWTEAAAAR